MNCLLGLHPYWSIAKVDIKRMTYSEVLGNKVYIINKNIAGSEVYSPNGYCL